MYTLPDSTSMSGARPIGVYVINGHTRYMHLIIFIRVKHVLFLFSCEEGEETDNLIGTKKLCGQHCSLRHKAGLCLMRLEALGIFVSRM
jgi:hypothetical protein